MSTAARGGGSGGGSRKSRCWNDEHVNSVELWTSCIAASYHRRNRLLSFSSLSSSEYGGDVGSLSLSGDPASFEWTPMPGLNPYDVRTTMRAALERTLFADDVDDADGRPLFNSTYGSVGGAIMGTARLPVTYGNMVEEGMFHDQLAVDTRRGRVPKIL